MLSCLFVFYVQMSPRSMKHALPEVYIFALKLISQPKAQVTCLLGHELKEKPWKFYSNIKKKQSVPMLNVIQWLLGPSPAQLWRNIACPPSKSGKAHSRKPCNPPPRIGHGKATQQHLPCLPNLCRFTWGSSLASQHKWKKKKSASNPNCYIKLQH